MQTNTDPPYDWTEFDKKKLNAVLGFVTSIINIPLLLITFQFTNLKYLSLAPLILFIVWPITLYQLRSYLCPRCHNRFCYQGNILFGRRTEKFSVLLSDKCTSCGLER